jgi:hypothetical protein
LSVQEPIAPILPDRFIEDEDTGCWIWQGALNFSGGYGHVARRRADRTTKRFYTHRLAYEEFIGAIPDGFTIDHLCRVPCCCNPGHLEAISRADNIRRGKGAKLSHELAAFIRASTLSNRELAEQIGVDDSQISRVRTGQMWT